MKRPRIIPTLLIEDNNLVKTKRFKSPIYLGDPLNAIRIFNEKNVDELCVMDIGASKSKRNPNFDLLSKMTSEAFMPLSYGGGIKSIDEIKLLFRIGFEKVIINTGFVLSEELIQKASKLFGSQSIVCDIDYKKTIFGNKCYIEDGKRRINIEPLELAKRAELCGAGEILLYAIDNDGKREGFDLELIKKVSSEINIPLIACGGANDIIDLKKALDYGASAVAAGSMFVLYGKKQAVLINYPDEKDLINAGIYIK